MVIFDVILSHLVHRIARIQIQLDNNKIFNGRSLRINLIDEQKRVINLKIRVLITKMNQMYSNNSRKNIKTRLVFLILTINLVMLSVVASNGGLVDVLNYGEDKSNIINYSGSVTFNFTRFERQLLVYNERTIVNTTQEPHFDVSHIGWHGEYYDLNVHDLSDVNFYKWEIQNDWTYITQRISIYSHDYNENKPMELGTNFTLDNPANVSNVYLNIGFNVVMNATHNNLVDMRNMVSDATIDIRHDNGSIAPVDLSVKSIPLSQCEIVRDYQADITGDTRYFFKTVWEVLQDDQAMDGMLNQSIIRVPVDHVLPGGDYWTVLNLKTNHVLTEPENEGLVRIDVFAYNGTDDSRVVNRTYDNTYFMTDHTNLLIDPSWDLYHVIDLKHYYSDPTKIDFTVDGVPVPSNGSLRLIMEEGGVGGGYKTFYLNSSISRGIFLKINVNATVNDTSDPFSIDSSATFEPAGNESNPEQIKWIGILTMNTPSFASVMKNTTFTILSQAPVDYGWHLSTLKVLDVNNTYVYSEFNETTYEIFVPNSGPLGYILYFEVLSSLNVITSTSDIDPVVDLTNPTSVTVKFEGAGIGTNLKLFLYRNGEYVDMILENVELNQDLIVDLSGFPGGAGYSIRGEWNDGVSVGCRETGSFELINPDYVDPDNPRDPDKPDKPDNPDGDQNGDDSNNPFENLNLPPELWGIIIAIISGLSLMQVIKKGKKKVKVPKLAKLATKMPNEDNIDDWF